MPNDLFYKSAEWKSARRARKRFDKWRCTVPGCGRTDITVDHIVPGSRSLRLEDLRSLCKEHDNQVKENKDGIRRSDGKFIVHGCDINGKPLDPNHSWNK
jgi:5-methylcytosine-specific restriction protein A